MSVLLCFQIAVITPALDALAKFRILHAIKESTDPKEMKYKIELKDEVRGLSPASSFWHVLSVAMEFVKAGLLCYMALVD